MTVTVRKGHYQSNLSTVRYVGAGSAVLQAIDDRTASFAYETGATDVAGRITRDQVSLVAKSVYTHRA